MAALLFLILYKVGLGRKERENLFCLFFHSRDYWGIAFLLLLSQGYIDSFSVCSIQGEIILESFKPKGAGDRGDRIK